MCVYVCVCVCVCVVVSLHEPWVLILTHDYPFLFAHAQIAMDTFHWNPIIHLFIWGSILSWLVVIPITSAPGLYGIAGFFEYLGVAYEVLATATFWIYLPIAVIIALLPTIIFRVVLVDIDPHIVDDVRLQQKKEGRRLFKRLKLRRKPVYSEVTRRATVKRTGYAYSHTEGFGDMITTGRIFGMDEREVADERRRRLSTIIGISRGTSPPNGSIKAALAATAAGVASAVATHGVLQEPREKEEKRAEISVEIYVEEREDETLMIDSKNTEREESKPQEEPSPTQAETLTEDSPTGGDLSAPDDVASEHGGSTTMLLPTKIDSSSDEEGMKANLITAQGDTTDDPPVSTNLPGSVESPSHDREEESVRNKGTSDDQKLLM